MTKASASILLICVFMARGTSFLFSKSLMQDMIPMSVLAVRFILAFCVLALVFHKKLLVIDRKTLLNGMILGNLYTICMAFEMYEYDGFLISTFEVDKNLNDILKKKYGIGYDN